MMPYKKLSNPGASRKFKKTNTPLKHKEIVSVGLYVCKYVPSDTTDKKSFNAKLKEFFDF